MEASHFRTYLTSPLPSMSVANLSSGTRPKQPTTTWATSTLTSSTSQTQILTKVDLLISLSLHNWAALTIAIENSVDTQIAQDKRDWFSGAISELFTSNQIKDADDLEEVLLQVMDDEFDVRVEDDSEVEVAQKLWRGRDTVLSGEFGEVDAMYERWSEKQKRGGEKVQFTRVEEPEDGQDTDWSEEEGDEEIGNSPGLAAAQKPPKQRTEPELDEDGFIQVVGRRKR